MIKAFGILAGTFLYVNAASQNYDEAKVPPYSLPDALLTLENKSVKTKRAWEESRRAQVLLLFEENVYGKMPKTYDSIRYTTVKHERNAMGGKARLKEIDITVWNAGKHVNIKVILFVPARQQSPSPVFLLINNRDTTNTDPARLTRSPFWPAEMIVDSGYAVAAFHVSNAAPDDKEAYNKGVLQLYPGQSAAPNGMKAIGSWAWGASRVMDYFTADKDIDSTRVAVVGHSRGGKASLWAGAQDRRFALVFSNCSGEGGAALSRRNFGETIKLINDKFPHWFADNYKRYNGNETALPVDQHMLLALMAPRPVYATSATKDLWADPTGTYLSLVHAQKVYTLYKSNPPLPASPPPANTPVNHPFLGYHNREGVHDLTLYDWTQFVRFANRCYGNR